MTTNEYSRKDSSIVNSNIQHIFYDIYLFIQYP